MTPVAPPASLYRGSQKHKNRPTEERKGTLCREWTHVTQSGGYGHDPFSHSWESTRAHLLFERAVSSANERRRFATGHGIAFEAKLTGDGSWHGYPVPREAVPAEIVKKWIDDGEVRQRDIRKHWRKDKDDLQWAVEAGTT